MADTVMERADRLADIHTQLVAAVADLANSDAWRRMLEVAARLPSYSPSNVLLIAVQRPDATRVAGYRTWASLGRHVRKGEKGIAILAPCMYRGRDATEDAVTRHLDEAPPDNENPHRELPGFRIVHVFDVSQTDGEPLPIVSPAQLVSPAPADLWVGLERLVKAEGFVVERGDCHGANGYTRFDDRTVRIRDDVEPSQAAKTLAHELGHIRADHETRFADQYHRSDDCRGIAEIEAESIAYLVTVTAGLDSAAYSVPYVAGWAGGDVGLLRSTATRVLSVASKIDGELRPNEDSPCPSGAPTRHVSPELREPGLAR